MPSLLDMIVRNRGGSTAGVGSSPLQRLLGTSQQGQRGQQAPQQARRLPASTIDSLLTDQDRQALLAQRLRTSGLGLLASDPSDPTVQRLGQGLLTGEEVVREARQDRAQRRIDLQELAIDLREEQRDAAMRRRRRRIFEGADLSDPQVRTNVMEKLLQGGDFKAAQRLNDFESNIQDKEIIEGSGKVTVIDPRTMEKTEIEVPDLRGEGVVKVNQGSRIGLMDKSTGEVITSVPVFPEPESTSERLERQQSTITDLSSTWRSNTEAQRGAWSMARKALDAEQNDIAGQQTLVVALNKLLDPESVVRQSEFARVAELGSLKDRAVVLKQQVVDEGQTMSPQVEREIRNEIRRLQGIVERELQNENQFILRRAREFGIDRPELIIPSRFRGLVGGGGNNNPFLSEENSGDSNLFEGI